MHKSPGRRKKSHPCCCQDQVLLSPGICCFPSWPQPYPHPRQASHPLGVLQKAGTGPSPPGGMHSPEHTILGASQKSDAVLSTRGCSWSPAHCFLELLGEEGWGGLEGLG